MNQIEVLDTTLRDGAQGAGVNYTREDKLRVIRALDQLGVDFIEAGNPHSNPKDKELFAFAAQKLTLKRSRLAAFGATIRVGARAKEDEGIRALLESEAQVISLFGKSSPFHVTRILRTTPEENLRMIRESVAYLCGHGRQVFFDAEHFFDGYKEDPEYALSALLAARDAGAERLILCDTNGGTLPEDAERITAHAVRAAGEIVGIHAHNDADLATAVTLSAVRAGAVQVQGTMGGYGERSGNANLCAVVPNIVLKMGRPCLLGDLAQLTRTARTVAEIANMPLAKNMPYVGRSAFTHKGGMHIDAILKDPASFEHIPPEKVGNERRLLVSEMAGRGALLAQLGDLAPELDKNSGQVAGLLSQVKEMEMKGYAYEDAQDSLKLLMLSALGRRKRFFEVLDFQVVSSKPEDEKSARAIVKVRVGGREEITADEGDGPVNALDKAVRKALSLFFPCIGRMRLTDFKVRVIDRGGTASKVRVRMDSGDGMRMWSTVGVSENIIEASFQALTDSIESMLMDEMKGGA